MDDATPARNSSCSDGSNNNGTMPTAVAANNNNNNNNYSHTEQPQTKRLKIEKVKSNSKIITKSTSATILNVNRTTPPDIINTRQEYGAYGNNKSSSNQLCSSLSSSSTHSMSTPSTTNNSPVTTPCTSRTTSFVQLLNVQNLVNNILPTTVTMAIATQTNTDTNKTPIERSHCKTHDEVDRVQLLPDLLTMTQTVAQSTPICATTTRSTNHEAQDMQISTIDEDMRDFELSLTKQCLCIVSERALRRPFQSHYSLDSNGLKRIAMLSEWPTNKLLQFLSNLQLLFDIYLKQNSKGFICARIMDVCDALIRNDHKLIDEIIVLAGYNNAYVQFLAGRVLAAFLVIAKQEINDDWLKKIVDNLFNYERLDATAVQKIHFSLDIIKRIVEWKDIELHPLEDEINTQPLTTPTTTATTSIESTEAAELENTNVMQNSFGYMHFPTQQPTLENNYFAVHFRSSANEQEAVANMTQSVNNEQHNRDGNDDHNDDELDDTINTDTIEQSVDVSMQQHLNDLSNFYGFNATNFSEDSRSSTPTQQEESSHVLNSPRPATSILANGCHIITLTDFESFDTSNLKCITIQKLENKWPALVKNMSALISASNNSSIEHAEHCILNFLQLWENIISVKANLSIDETRPFYVQLDKFELLLNHNLTCTVYKQMLCLFNEALCYGSTLALQDMLPDETCMLAHQIVRHVKDYSILESLPRRQPENIVSLIGFKCTPITYLPDSLQSYKSTETLATGADVIEMDKTILQKMVLLVLKSIAVTVKEIRSDSSDSSIDSSDYDAFQDMLLIERSIRDVLSKLETFIKHTLEFHPECHFSKILIHLFDDQDDHLIEAMVCTLDVTSGISFRNNAFPELVAMLNPVYTFLEFLKMTSNSSDLLLDLLVSNETCFLLYLLRFLKYIRLNWMMFVQSCHDFGMGAATLDEAMSVFIRLRLQISRLVSRQLYPYDISPVLRLLESCESLYEGNELS